MANGNGALAKGNGFAARTAIIGRETLIPVGSALAVVMALFSGGAWMHHRFDAMDSEIHGLHTEIVALRVVQEANRVQRETQINDLRREMRLRTALRFSLYDAQQVWSAAGRINPTLNIPEVKHFPQPGEDAEK